MRNQEKHVEQTQAFVRTGIQPDINLATVQTALANAKVQLVTARNNYAVAEAQLAQAMGVSVGDHYALADAEVPPIAGEDGSASSAGRARGEEPSRDRQPGQPAAAPRKRRSARSRAPSDRA